MKSTSSVIRVLLAGAVSFQPLATAIASPNSKSGGCATRDAVRACDDLVRSAANGPGNITGIPTSPTSPTSDSAHGDECDQPSIDQVGLRTQLGRPQPIKLKPIPNTECACPPSRGISICRTECSFFSFSCVQFLAALSSKISRVDSHQELWLQFSHYDTGGG